MTQDEAPFLNPNTADDEELRQLPGVGPQLAARIIRGRPYESLEDLRQVPGLGESALETIEPYLTFEVQEPEAKPASGVNSSTEPSSGTEQAKPEPVKYPLVLTEPRPKGASLWALIAVGAASVVCSVTLTLAILAGINGTLNFGRHSALLETQSELRQIRSQLEAIQTETEALRGRAEALEGMSGRMTEVESQVAELDLQIVETLAAVDEIRTELAATLEETRTQAERVNRFQAFLDGLGQLIGQVVTEP
jgi:hypothetical protein